MGLGVCSRGGIKSLLLQNRKSIQVIDGVALRIEVREGSRLGFLLLGRLLAYAWCSWGSLVLGRSSFAWRRGSRGTSLFLSNWSWSWYCSDSYWDEVRCVSGAGFDEVWYF